MVTASIGNTAGGSGRVRRWCGRARVQARVQACVRACGGAGAAVVLGVALGVQTPPAPDGNLDASEASEADTSESAATRAEPAETEPAGWALSADMFTIGGTVAGAYQYQFPNGASSADDAGGGAFVFQPTLSFAPTERDEVFVKLGFAVGNGLNDKPPFVLDPWAADLEGSVRDINGSGRSYVLTAWYEHTFDLGIDHTLSVAGGLIDATDYLDLNKYSNDEFSQFMNGALTNAPNVLLPSYDPGVAVQWERAAWSAAGVAMWVDELLYNSSFTFVAAQMGYRWEHDAGEGNFRFLLGYGSQAFLDPTGTVEEARWLFTISADQELGDVLGVWTRLSHENGEAALAYQAVVSAGVNINGLLWGREHDEIGIGYVYLKGGNVGLVRSQVFEAYVRLGLLDGLDLTFDAQYVDDDLEPAAGPGANGWILGTRLVFVF